MKSYRTSWFLLGAALLGCSGVPAPDEAPNETGGSPPLTSSGAGGAPAAGSSSAVTGGAQARGGAEQGGPTGGMATGGFGAAGASSGASGGGDTSMAGGASNAGSSGASMGGTPPGGGAGGGGNLDPALLPEVTLHLAGDSTVMTYAADSAQEGWGQELPQFLLSKVKLDNQALGGASVETFYTGRWKNIMTSLRAGDYVMAAFGANDSGNVEGRHVEPPDFRARFGTMAQEVMAKQATFIIVTPSAMQEWSGGKNTNNRLGPYVTVLHALSETKALKLVDLNARSLEFVNQIGQEAAKEIYIDGDKAHFTKKGATRMAELVAHELTRIGSPLGDYVK